MPDAKKIVSVTYPYLALVLLLLYGFYSEKIPVNEGRGYHLYEAADRVADLSGLFRKEYPASLLRHILPVTIVHHVFKFFSITPAAKQIVLACTALNCLCIFGMLLLWRKTTKILEITFWGELVGAMALSINGMVKFLMFYPSMIYDGPVYFLGSLMLYLWLSRNSIALFITVLLSTVIHEFVTLSAFILFLFPPLRELGTKESHKVLSSHLVVILLVSFTAAYGIFMYNIDIGYFKSLNFTKMESNNLIHLSIFLALTYILFALHPILSGIKLDTKQFNIAFFMKLFFCITMLAIASKTIAYYSSGIPPILSKFPNNVFYYIGNATYDAPGYFFINKLVSFGPLIVLAAFSWKDFVTTTMKYGYGITLCLVIAIFRALETEPRHYLEIFPILVPFIVLSFQHKLTRSRTIYLFFISVVFSKLWAPLSLNFPEYYFWGFGSFFSSYQGYFVQLLATLFCILFTLIAFRDETPKPNAKGN